MNLRANVEGAFCIRCGERVCGTTCPKCLEEKQQKIRMNRLYDEAQDATEAWFRDRYALEPTPIDSTEDVQPVYEHTSPATLRAAEHLSRTVTKSIAEFERWAGGSFSCFDDLRKAVERFEGARMAQEPKKED